MNFQRLSSQIINSSEKFIDYFPIFKDEGRRRFYYSNQFAVSSFETPYLVFKINSKIILSKFRDQNYLDKTNYNLLDYKEIITRINFVKYKRHNFRDYFNFSYSMRNCYLLDKDVKHFRNIIIEIPHMRRDIKWKGKCTCREYADSKNYFKNGIKDIFTTKYNLISHDNIRIISEKQLSEIIPITLFLV